MLFWIALSCQSTDSERVQSLSQEYTIAWNSQIPSQVADFYADDAILVINGDTVRGRLSVVNFAKSFMRNFPDMNLTMDSLVYENPYYKYHWSFTGTYAGLYGNGNKVIFQGVEKWTLNQEGKIMVSVGTYDEDDFRKQLNMKNKDGAKE